GERTTPEAPELQARLAALRGGGASAVAMEVSSHALAQHRVDAVWFAVAVFTNLSQDHLDFHGSMEEYFAAKASLFDPGRARVASNRWWPASPSPFSSTTPTLPTASNRSSTQCGRRPRDESSSCSARAATATGTSVRRWGRQPRGCPTSPFSRRTIPGARIP